MSDDSSDLDDQRPVGRADLPFPLVTAGDGVHAVFDARDRLRSLHLVRDGVETGPRLEVDPDAGTARFAQVRRYPNGGDEEFPMRDFVLAALDDFARALPGAPLRCAFCEKTNAEVRRLIAGPTCYICDECVTLCADILTEQ